MERGREGNRRRRGRGVGGKGRERERFHSLLNHHIFQEKKKEKKNWQSEYLSRNLLLFIN